MTKSVKKETHLHLSLLAIPSSVAKGSTIVTIASFIPDLKITSAERDFDFVPIQSPWLDRQSVHLDYGKVHEIHQLNMPILANYLKVYNIGCQFDDKFWQTLLSPWLFIIIMNFLNKQKFINQALNDHMFDSYSVLQEPSKHLRYDNDEEYSTNLRFNENWNFALYTIILRATPKLKFSKQVFCEPKSYKKDKIKEPSLISNFVHSISKFLAKYFSANFIFYGSYFDRLTLIRLHLALGTIPLIFNKFKVVDSAHVTVNRKDLKDIDTVGSGNEPAFSKILKYTLPVYSLENFKTHINYVSNMGKLLNPKAIITASSLWFDTTFKFYVAYARFFNHKIPLMLIQHGGCNGFVKSDLVDIEQSFADYYLTWGFVGTEVSSNNVRFGNPKPSFKINRSNNSEGRIALVRSYAPRQVQMVAAEIDSDEQYFQDSVNFVSRLEKNVINDHLILRLYPQQRAYNSSIEIGNNEKFFWEREFKQAKIDDTTDIMKIYANSSLVIYTYLQGTGYVECLANNIPVIILSRFFDDLVHPEFEPLYKELKREKIIFDDPILAAQHVNDIHKDVNAWWLQENVQHAVQKFNEVYCFKPTNRIGSFKETISSLIHAHK